MPRPRPQHLHREVSRHGKVKWYVRIGKGPRIRLHAPYGTPEFMAEYKAATSGRPQVEPRQSSKGTLCWLVDRYMDSSRWAELSPATQAQRRNVLFRVLTTAGDEPFEAITRASILSGIDRRKATPAAARHFLRAMRYLFDWAVYAQLAPANPTDGVKSPRLKRSGGWHVWTEEECQRYEARWPLGTRERLAFDVLLWTGLRRGDAVKFGRQHIGKDGMARLRQSKTGGDVSFTILPPLHASIKATAGKGLTFIATLSGGPMTPASFGMWFADACAAADVPGSAHGLRKAGATRAASYLTPHELMAMYGWADLRMASHYTATANRDKLSLQGGGKLQKGLATKRKTCV